MYFLHMHTCGHPVIYVAYFKTIHTYIYYGTVQMQVYTHEACTLKWFKNNFIQNCESHEIAHVCFTCQQFILLSCACGYTQTARKIDTCS